MFKVQNLALQIASVLANHWNMHMYIINVIVVRNLLVVVNLVNVRVSLSCCRVMAIHRLTVKGAALDL